MLLHLKVLRMTLDMIMVVMMQAFQTQVIDISIKQGRGPHSIQRSLFLDTMRVSIVAGAAPAGHTGPAQTCRSAGGSSSLWAGCKDRGPCL